MILSNNLCYVISNHDGFGLNTDIFETNILNLSVVVGVLFYYGRIILGDIISSRKESILKNLQDAENKFKEAERNLLQAKENFETARVRAEQIRLQGNTVSLQTAKLIVNSIEEDIKRLKTLNLTLIKLEQEKSVGEICQELSQIALVKAAEKINKKMNYNLQKKFIIQNIDKLALKTNLNN